ncbi:hypothetical protein PENTCL1PPCAC_23903, partial [Pristionchus entomophagus]
LLVLSAVLCSIIAANPSAPRTFPCVVTNHYTPQEFVECDTQCYSITLFTHNARYTPQGKRIIRRGCAGKDDLLERARFELEHKIALIPTDCRNVGTGILRDDGEITLSQQCCTKAFCNVSSTAPFFLPLLIAIIACLFH